MPAFSRLVSRLRRCHRGTAAVEFALLAPMLLLLLVGMLEFGLAVNEKMRLTGAARAGAQYGFKQSEATAAITSAVADAAALDAADIVVTVTKSCGCQDGSSLACTAACGDGSARRTYVTVGVTESWPMMLKYPGFTDPLPLSAEATLRID